MGKVVIEILFLFHRGCLSMVFKFQNCFLSTSLCFMRLLSESLNLTGCQGDKKGECSKRKQNNNKKNSGKNHSFTAVKTAVYYIQAC